jgi:hypothetical protein
VTLDGSTYRAVTATSSASVNDVEEVKLWDGPEVDGGAVSCGNVALKLSYSSSGGFCELLLYICGQPSPRLGAHRLQTRRCAEDAERFIDEAVYEEDLPISKHAFNGAHTVVVYSIGKRHSKLGRWMLVEGRGLRHQKKVKPQPTGH